MHFNGTYEAEFPHETGNLTSIRDGCTEAWITEKEVNLFLPWRSQLHPPHIFLRSQEGRRTAEKLPPALRQKP